MTTAKNFSIEPGDVIEWRDDEWIIKSLHDHSSGRVPCVAINLRDGREGLPFADECNIVQKTITHGQPHEISLERAQQLRLFAAP